MTTIFQMSRDELESLLIFLRPRYADPEQRQSAGATFDAARLRMLITEWLLMNGLSTLHKFNRETVEPCTSSALVDDNVVDKSTSADNDESRCCRVNAPLPDRQAQWQMPNKMDCASCGKYRVGRPLSIYETGQHFANGSAVVTREPLSAVAELPLDVGATAESGSIIRTRPDGTLKRVHYSTQSDLEPPRAPVRGDDVDGGYCNGMWSGLCLSRGKDYRIDGNNYDVDNCQQQNNNYTSLQVITTTAATTTKPYHHQQEQQRRVPKTQPPYYYYYGQQNANDSARSDTCADMCLVCLLCECHPPLSQQHHHNKHKNNNNNNNDCGGKGKVKNKK